MVRPSGGSDGGLAPAASGLTTRGTKRPRLSLATLCLVLFLTFLDNTVVSVTLASIQSSLPSGVTDLQWVVGAYVLVFASLMLAFGALGDRIGRKEVMLAGVAVFCLGSLLGALAPNISVLWAARATMGLGAAASEPGTLSMIRQLYSERSERARALGAWTAISGLALAAGPIIGGTLVGVWNWRAVFWFNLFFGALALAGAAVVLPESSDPRRDRRFDYGGFVLGAASLGCATFAVIAGETSGYAAPLVVSLFVAAGVALVAFLVQEQHAQEPALNLSFFRLAPFSGSCVVAFATYFSVFSVFFFVALYLEVVGSQSGYAIALDFLPMAAAMVIVSVLTGRWVAASGVRMPMFTGAVLSTVGIVLTSTHIVDTGAPVTLRLALAVAGIGFGMTMVPVTSAALAVVPPQHSGVAASMTNTARELGAVAGVAVLGSVVNAQLTVGLSRRLAAIGIPLQYRATVIAAVTTGSIGGQAKSAETNKSIAEIVERVTNAAYNAFSDGLHISLAVSAALMAISAIVALATMRRVTPAEGEGLAVTGSPTAQD
jgi:EmrB/QacA subfamily drug resistance transporter